MSSYNKFVRPLSAFMFSLENMAKESSYNGDTRPRSKPSPPTHGDTPSTPTAPGPAPGPAPASYFPKERKVIPMPTTPIKAVPIKAEPIIKATFQPFQKDKLFWCFYYLYKGQYEYDLHRADHFVTEKKFKIETVEKLGDYKEQLKAWKIKRTEIEDEFVNQPQITLKGLQVLALVYNVPLTYIYGRKYCVFAAAACEAAPSACEADAAAACEAAADPNIIQFENGFYKVLLRPAPGYIRNVYSHYWHIKNAQKPLQAPSAYTLPELLEISAKLEILPINPLGKKKTKPMLYEEILQHL